MPVNSSNRPPQPTDLNGKTLLDQDIRRCPHCGTIRDLTKEDTHSCTEIEETVTIEYLNKFGIIIPEKTGYVWKTKTAGFAICHVHIQGTLIPIGDVRKTIIGDENISVSEEKFSQFDDPEWAKRIFEMGLRVDIDSDYSYIDLGEKLVRERLKGVYTEDQTEKEQLLSTRDERINSVWEEINSTLPFTYDRVAAPHGYPVTQEGIRWINITGQNHPEWVNDDNKLLFEQQWVDYLTDTDKKVALIYPNSD